MIEAPFCSWPDLWAVLTSLQLILDTAVPSCGGKKHPCNLNGKVYIHPEMTPD